MDLPCKTYLTICAVIKGITINVKRLFARLNIFSVLLFEKNNNKYTGSNTNCSTKFIGRIDKLRGTSPFAILVNNRYQSVHGVKINMKKPRSRLIFPCRNKSPKK